MMKTKKKISPLFRTAPIACALFSVIPSQVIAAVPENPNVLLIICDDLNDFEGVFGGHPQAQTPNIDRLAASGVQFLNAHSAAPICGPSRTAFMTGIYPSTSKNFSFENWYQPEKDSYTINPILENSKTLMRYMRDNGYASYRAGKIMHHDLADTDIFPDGSLQQDWDETGPEGPYGPVVFDPNAIGGVGEVVNHPSIPITFFEGAGNLGGLFGSLANIPTVNGYTGWWNSGWKSAGAFNYVDDNNRDDMQDEETRKWAVDKINALAASDPTGESEKFFLAVGFHNPHVPFVAPQEYFDLYPLETLELPPRVANDVDDTFFNKNLPPHTSTLKTYSSMLESVAEAAPDGTTYATEEAFLKAYLQAYLACVSFVDTQVGALVDALDASPYADNTVVIFTSDHGYEWGEKEALSKNTLWETSTRVPLVIRVPGLEANANQKVSAPVGLIDLYPTVKDLCGLTADTRKNANGAELDGYSLKPFLLDPANAVWDGPAVALSEVSGNDSDLAGSKNFAVRSLDWRYIRYENGMEELYDLQNDPYEFTNLIGSSDSEVRANYEFLVNGLLSLVPDLAKAGRNLLIDPGFEWLSDSSQPDPGGQPWGTEEDISNPWQIGRENTIVRSGKYALKYNQRWTDVPVKQVLTEPLDANLVYTVSFWMLRSSDVFDAANNASVDIELWSCDTIEGSYSHRADLITAAQNSVADTWEQFSGSFDASSLAAYDGEFLQLRIVRNTNVKQRIYVDDFVMDAFIPNSFAQWAFNRGLNAAGYAYDIDGDGLSTLEEYAFGGDPEDVASRRHSMEIIVGASGVTYRYPMRKDGALNYEIEHTEDLATMSWSTGGFVPQAPTQEYDSDYWKVESILSPAPDQCFIRVKAKQ